MKNLFRMTGIIALAAIIGFTVVACGGGLSGSYSLQGGGDLTYNFLSGGKFTMESGSKMLGEGTFKTSGGKLTMSANGVEQTWDYKFEGKNLIMSAEGLTMTLAKQ